MGIEELKSVLLSELTEEKYNREILINIYVRDPGFVKQMVKEGKCPDEILEFLDNNVQKISDVYNQVTIPFLELQNMKS